MERNISINVIDILIGTFFFPYIFFAKAFRYTIFVYLNIHQIDEKMPTDNHPKIYCPILYGLYLKSTS